MKTTLRIIPAIIFMSLFTTASFSQISIPSTDGYQVNISIQPSAIVPTTNGCVNGYNYNVKMNYTVAFTGNNRPSSLYTLQGTLGCGATSHFFDLPNNGGSGEVTSVSNVWTSLKDCATANVVSKSCNTVNIQISGPGISSRTVSFTGLLNTPLPVMLVSFTAEASKSSVQLNWATATQINNDFFSIERSTDGTNWSVIKTVKGAGNSSSFFSYTYNDVNPVSGTAYYRLKQTDTDGKFTYSDNRAVKFTGTTIVSIFPVPNAGNNISFKGIAEPKNTTIAVSDAAGITVYTAALISNNVELPSLAAGMYVIRLKNKVTGEVNNLRYVKI